MGINEADGRRLGTLVGANDGEMDTDGRTLVLGRFEGFVETVTSKDGPRDTEGCIDGGLEGREEGCEDASVGSTLSLGVDDGVVDGADGGS